ncbi:MAG TPA: hypothetical protein VME45_09245 [Stellaceae bacterium]|nr:hypothetical protein [Stellaceae bacterium]
MDGGASRASGIKGRGLEEDEGCAFILDDDAKCGAWRREGSPYCGHHHALCHVSEDSRGGRRRLKEAEALASAVGGRTGKPARLPPDPVLRRLENVARGFARANRSRFVQKG